MGNRDLGLKFNITEITNKDEWQGIGWATIKYHYQPMESIIDEYEIIFEESSNTVYPTHGAVVKLNNLTRKETIYKAKGTVCNFREAKNILRDIVFK